MKTGRSSAETSTSSSQEHLVRHFPLLACAKGYEIPEEVSCWSIFRSLNVCVPAGSSGRMFPESCPRTEDGTLLPCSGVFQNSGMGGPTGSWTASTSEHVAFQGQSPSEDGASSSSLIALSEVLETGSVPQRYFLTPRACQGILRRSDKRDKELPPTLRAALEEQSKK